MKQKTHALLITAILLEAFLPSFVLAADSPYEQEFIITAYYSPLPNQCCYVRGNFSADVILNGEGEHAADGTAVYPGIAAAPATYAFGTRIQLPDIGVVTVHDRGGAIQELGTGVHRLDLWMGSGEEGLARALAFGVKYVKGTVYPLGSEAPQESLTLADFSAPLAMIRPYVSAEPDLLALRPKRDDRSISVELLQKSLKEVGYFYDAPSGWFGPATEASLNNFNADFGLTEPSDVLTEQSAATLVAALAHKETPGPLSAFVERGSPRTVVLEAQRTLRFLGTYRGRTNGVYDDALFSAILTFQQEQALVSNASSPGAGRIGPKTKERIVMLWKRTLVAKQAERLVALAKIETLLSERGSIPEEFLAEGETSDDVRRLQRLLADRGFFPSDRVSGTFGEVTRDAVVAYQIAAGLLTKETDKGAGYVGPATIASLKREEKVKLWRLVRAEGWQAL